MRFRLGTSGAGASPAADGFGRGFQALFMSPMLTAQAAEQAETAGMRRKAMESQIAAHIADAALKNSKATALNSAPDVFGSVIASRAGTDVPTFKRWREGVSTGAGQTTSPTGFDDLDELIGIKPQPTIDPAVAKRLTDEFQRFAPVLVNPEDVRIGDYSTALGNYQKQDLLDAVLGGRQQPGVVGQAVAASKGSKLVDNIGNTGEGYNIFTGAGTTLNPGLRALFGEEGAALVQQRKAAAGASGASAALSNARRERVSGGFEKPVTIIDEDTGDATVTRLPTGGDPVSIGVAPRKAGGVDATNAKERNRITSAVEKEMPGATDAEIVAEVERRLERRGIKPGSKPAAAPAPAAASSLDMGKANAIKARVKAGTLSREEGIKQLRALGFK